ncbi:precorrin-6A/cobalt-precorrin-6A reductase, partial [Klebsiella pneumoniae]
YPCQSVITKDSGKAGGVDDKILAARDLGLACIVIRRPKMEYRNVFRDIEELIKRLKEEQREA